LRRGVAVPAHLAVCGFKDLPASAWMSPSVTTFGTPRYRVGFEAAALLRAVIKGEAPPAMRIDLGFTLMARERLRRRSSLRPCRPLLQCSIDSSLQYGLMQ
jgi:LacI family gluconate utilization system Gnt-I transcriptional repressor